LNDAFDPKKHEQINIHSKNNIVSLRSHIKNKNKNNDNDNKFLMKMQLLPPFLASTSLISEIAVSLQSYKSLVLLESIVTLVKNISKMYFL
jgi:hypothetical protein